MKKNGRAVCEVGFKMIFNAQGGIISILRQTSTTQLEPTPMVRLWSGGESDVVQLWLDGWLVGRSGYTGMRGLLFV